MTKTIRMRRFSIELKWAVIFSIVTLLWVMLEKMAGLHDEHIDRHPIYTNLFAIVAIAVFIIAVIDKKKNHYNGVMGWTQGFLSGVVISVMIAVLSPLVQWITFSFISPDFLSNMIDYSVSRKLHTRDQAEMYFSLNNYILLGATGALSMGVVTSAIVALLVKSKNSK